MEAERSRRGKQADSQSRVLRVDGMTLMTATVHSQRNEMMDGPMDRQKRRAQTRSTSSVSVAADLDPKRVLPCQGDSAWRSCRLHSPRAVDLLTG